MQRLVGIDIGHSYIRAVALNVSHKKTSIEDMREVALSEAASLEHAIQMAADSMVQHADGISVAIDGERVFVHRIELPRTALKQLEEVLPYELEARLPIDVADVAFDKKILKSGPDDSGVVVLCGAARIEHIKERIAVVERALGRQPDKVACGMLPLANLCAVSPQLSGPGPICVIELSAQTSELLLLSAGEAVFARTLSQGVNGLPDTAPALLADIRQTFAAWYAEGGAEIQNVFLIGGGAAAEGAEEYLGYYLNLGVARLAGLAFDQLSPDHAELLPRFSSAVALALGLTSRSRDLDLRQGSLALERGYEFLKEKIPVLSGLAAAILISFVFATWAELRVLEREHESLKATLNSVSAAELGQTTEDPAEAMELLDRAKSPEEADPQPKMDAFDVLVEFSKVVPMDVTHDIEEFDMHRGHVKINGIVSTTNEAQAISNEMKKQECFTDVKISKITQVINSDRQKYILEFDVKCKGEAKKKKRTPEKAATR